MNKELKGFDSFSELVYGIGCRDTLIRIAKYIKLKKNNETALADTLNSINMLIESYQKDISNFEYKWNEVEK